MKDSCKDKIQETENRKIIWTENRILKDSRLETCPYYLGAEKTNFVWRRPGMDSLSVSPLFPEQLPGVIAHLPGDEENCYWWAINPGDVVQGESVQA